MPAFAGMTTARLKAFGHDAAGETAEPRCAVPGVAATRQRHRPRHPLQRHSRAGGNPVHLASRVRSRRGAARIAHAASTAGCSCCEVAWVPAFAGMTVWGGRPRLAAWQARRGSLRLKAFLPMMRPGRWPNRDALAVPASRSPPRSDSVQSCVVGSCSLGLGIM
jgi:hypothetical protein